MLPLLLLIRSGRCSRCGNEATQRLLNSEISWLNVHAPYGTALPDYWVLQAGGAPTKWGLSYFAEDACLSSHARSVISEMKSPNGEREPRRFLSNSLPARWSFRPPSASRRRSHSPAMLPASLLEGERKSCAICCAIFRQSPYAQLPDVRATTSGHTEVGPLTPSPPNEPFRRRNPEPQPTCPKSKMCHRF